MVFDVLKIYGYKIEDVITHTNNRISGFCSQKGIMNSKKNQKTLKYVKIYCFEQCFPKVCTEHTFLELKKGLQNCKPLIFR